MKTIKELCVNSDELNFTNYKKLIKSNIEIIKKEMKPSAERTHIIKVLKESIYFYFPRDNWGGVSRVKHSIK